MLRPGIHTLLKQCWPRIFHVSGTAHWKIAAKKLAMLQAVMNDPTLNVSRLWIAIGVICQRSTRTEVFEIAKAVM